MKSVPGSFDSFEGLEDLARRLSNLVRMGTIESADYNAAKVKVKYGKDSQGGDLVTGWLRWIADRAGDDRDWDAPEVGEQVMVISPNGDMRLGVVFPAIYQDAHAAPANSKDVHRRVYKDGAVIEYNRATHCLSATLPSGGTTELTSPGGVQINGPTTINGEVTINGNTQVNGGDVKADDISLKYHNTDDSLGGACSKPKP
ncbi:phage baseplate assembly protein V [Thiomicrorhabdus sp. Kp2]|uniref:phage baseplate assembly protein V n=1 Tax=Thiomicrorhabdus sp. Kp2 TaxID=1123518 RepID=UPI00041AD7B2|nr:phage baseplate assembly protein V [Thiomicrorhabdus sp. Kp2]